LLELVRKKKSLWNIPTLFMLACLKEHEGTGSNGSGASENGGKNTSTVRFASRGGTRVGSTTGRGGRLIHVFLGLDEEPARVDILRTEDQANRISVSLVGLGEGRGPVRVTRGTGAVQLSETGNERGSQGTVGLDELDIDGGWVRGDDFSRGAGGGPGKGEVSAGDEDSAEIIWGSDGVVEVGVVRDFGLDGGSEGQSGSDDGLGEHYRYVKGEGRGRVVVAEGWKRW
jgi:hypothetical protein